MAEQASPALIEVLTATGLCNPADLRQVARRVAHLTHDLPAFDIVWLDALVTTKRITPFQANLIGEGQAHLLRQGPYLLETPLSRHANPNTFLARRLDSSQKVVLKRVTSTSSKSTVGEALRTLLVKLQQHPIPAAISLTHLERDGETWLVESPPVTGHSLADLLVRRGRFRADVVVALARQLLSHLQAIHAAGVIHGDLLLSNVLLTPSGQLKLVDTGIRPSVEPVWSIHADRPCESLDTLAWEVAQGNSVSVKSDLYSAGCLLWQLLAGRPPVSTVDRFQKLAAHRMKPIPDVREFAPDTPPNLAAAIEWLTQRELASRPDQAANVLQRLGPAPWRQACRVKTYFREWEPEAPYFVTRPKPKSISKKVIAAALAIVAACGLVAADSSLRTKALAMLEAAQSQPGSTPTSPNALPQELATSLEVAKPVIAGAAPNGDNRFAPWPAPNANGLIELTSPGPYLAQPFESLAPITISARPGVCPVIEITGGPLAIFAPEVTLQNLKLHYQPQTSQTSAGFMCLAETTRLTVEGCSFEVTNAASTQSTTRTVALAWKLPADTSSLDKATAQIIDTILTGPMVGFYAPEGPTDLSFENVLKAGAGPLSVCTTTQPPKGAEVHGRQLTFRDGASLLRLGGTVVEEENGGQLLLTIEDSVLESPDSLIPLVELYAEVLRPDWQQAVLLAGDGTLVPEEAPLAQWKSLSNGDITILADSQLDFQGILRANFQFAPDDGSPLTRYSLSEISAPQRSTSPPGFDSSRITLCPSE